MTKSEINLIHRAIDLLQKLVSPEEPQAGGPAPRRCPVTEFVTNCLMRDPAQDVTTTELWHLYGEISDAGELEPLAKHEFLRALPGVMKAALGVRKCRAIRRDGQVVRGFKCVGIRV